MFFKFSAECIELKSCPFCKGNHLEIGVSENPFIVWDDAVRGERVAYIICDCGAMMKQEADVFIDVYDDRDYDELKQELLECAEKIARKWNKREQ